MNQLITFLSKGGIVMIPLTICSVIALAITLEKLLTQRYNKIIPKPMVNRVDNISSYNDLSINTINCERYTSPFSSLVQSVIQNANLPLSEIKEELSDKARQEVRVLDKGLTTLETIATITPVMGLLGTVIGMIKVFSVISKDGMANPSILSAGISEALITTATGLTIALPTLIMYHYFNKRNESIIMDLEENLNTLIKKLKIIIKQDKNANKNREEEK